MSGYCLDHVASEEAANRSKLGIRSNRLSVSILSNRCSFLLSSPRPLFALALPLSLLSPYSEARPPTMTSKDVHVSLTADELYAVLDKDGNGVLDKAEFSTFLGNSNCTGGRGGKERAAAGGGGGGEGEGE